jgi:asparagine synthase (glutamine-hydrolysing)
MCGIVGVVDLENRAVSRALVKRMTDAIAHRGPDGEGQYVDRSVGLGHRRLAIIDLSDAGSQPMADAAGEIFISYNGEVYNFRELREDLEALGHRFRSSTDTEVVLNAYKEWGESCVTRFNGMFAFAIWDAAKQKLTLARDRYGIKPLYYYTNHKLLAFASEIKALLAHPEISARVDEQALLEYFTFQNMFTDRTLFESVKLLPPGCIAAWKPSERQLKISRYWNFDFREPVEAHSPKEYEDELHHLFEKAVRRQLVSDVPVGAYLSGGMDSAAITAVAAREIPGLASFTGGFDLSSASGIELGFDERPRAEAFSYLFATELYEVVLKSGDMERIMSPLIWHLEDLRVGQCYPNYYVARLAAKFVKVVLAGTGGDELFAGYPWRYYHASTATDFDSYVKGYYDSWQRLVPNPAMSKLFRSDLWNRIKDTETLDIFRSVIDHDVQVLVSQEEYINRSLYFEAKTFLHGLLLIEDKLSMAHSLETRVPMLDNDLVDFAMHLPIRTLLHDFDLNTRIDENEPGSKPQRYFERTNDGKQLLRQMLRRYLPTQYVTAAKQGFSAPDASWFRGDSIGYVRRFVLDPKAKMYEYLRFDTVSELVNDHLSGRRNRRLLIWSLLSFEWWVNLFLN